MFAKKKKRKLSSLLVQASQMISSVTTTIKYFMQWQFKQFYGMPSFRWQHCEGGTLQS